MSGIDAVIARSRQPGAMSSRKRFTVSRKRAIQKLRQFALADPYAYILELIQAAVANGAVYVDLQTSKQTVTLSYVGGGLREDELASLFDFLFASKDRRDVADVRALALGLNAALRFEPDAVIVESGDGSPKGTTRMTLRPGSDEVEIGKPELPLAGTYVRIEGMKRRALGKAWRAHADLDPVREIALIESRCMAAPIPIVIDGESKFGFSSQRIPKAPGYSRTLEIDEGDLYGTIGIDPGWGRASFVLLTYGVRITSKARAFVAPGKQGGPDVGGILCYSALRKTVDHSGIVEDRVYEEMWARVWPYVRKLSSGHFDGTSPYQVCLLGHDEELEIAVLRELLLSSPRVVLIDRALEETQWAASIGNALDAPVLCAHPEAFDDLRALAGEAAHILRPFANDMPFFDGAALGPPPRPWLVEAIEAQSRPISEFHAALATRLPTGGVKEAREAREASARAVVGDADPRVTIYLPDSDVGVTPTRMEVRVCDRRVAVRECPEYPSGRVIVVEFPELSPARLAHALAIELPERGEGWAPCFDDLVAPLADGLEDAVRKIGEAVLAKLVRAGSSSATARTLAAQALAQKLTAVLSLRGGNAHLELWSVSGDELGADFPVLRSREAGGELLSLRQVVARANDGDGLVYATTPEDHAELDSIARERVLALEIGQEEFLLELLDDASYVRIDRREVLARAGEFVVRDRAPGVEPPTPTGLPVERALAGHAGYDTAVEEALVTQLISRFLGTRPERPDDRAALADWEVCRREAAGHLRIFLCRKLAAGEGIPKAWMELPLFVDGQRRAWSLRGVGRLAQRGGLRLRYGDPDRWGVGVRNTVVDPEVDEATLIADLFTAKALVHAFPSSSSTGQQAPREALEHSVVLSSGAVARLRLLAGDQRDTALVAVVDPKGDETLEIALAQRYGVRGVIEVRRSTSEVPELISGASRALWMTAVERLRVQGVDSPEGVELAGLALELIERCLHVSANSAGALQFKLHDPIAQHLAAIPFFELREGGRASARGLLRRAARARIPDPRAHLLERLAHTLHPVLRGWIERAFDPARVHRLREHEGLELAHGERLELPLTATKVGHGVRAWINALRPDPARLEHCFVHYLDGDDRSIIANTTHARIDLEDPRVAMLLRASDPDDPAFTREFAMLLLATYGAMNYWTDEIELEHELAFQRRVMQALETDTLHALRVPTS